MASYTVSDQAYRKIIFHAAKYPHRPVNGVLLGSSTQPRRVLISDAIPLLHHWTNLSPMMEIGWDLARSHAESAKLQVVGYYQATERLDDTALAPVGERVASKVQEQFSDAVAFVVDGDKIASGQPALIPYFPQASSSSWRPYPSQAFVASSPFVLSETDSPSRTVTLIRESSLHKRLYDFDDHLENVALDWLRNPACDDRTEGDKTSNS